MSLCGFGSPSHVSLSRLSSPIWTEAPLCCHNVRLVLASFQPCSGQCALTWAPGLGSPFCPCPLEGFKNWKQMVLSPLLSWGETHKPNLNPIKFRFHRPSSLLALLCHQSKAAHQSVSETFHLEQEKANRNAHYLTMSSWKRPRQHWWAAAFIIY